MSVGERDGGGSHLGELDERPPARLLDSVDIVVLPGHSHSQAVVVGAPGKRPPSADAGAAAADHLAPEQPLSTPHHPQHPVHHHHATIAKSSRNTKYKKKNNNNINNNNNHSNNVKNDNKKTVVTTATTTTENPDEEKKFNSNKTKKRSRKQRQKDKKKFIKKLVINENNDEEEDEEDRKEQQQIIKEEGDEEEEEEEQEDGEERNKKIVLEEKEEEESSLKKTKTEEEERSKQDDQKSSLDEITKAEEEADEEVAHTDTMVLDQEASQKNAEEDKMYEETINKKSILNVLKIIEDNEEEAQNNPTLLSSPLKTNLNETTIKTATTLILDDDIANEVNNSIENLIVNVCEEEEEEVEEEVEVIVVDVEINPSESTTTETTIDERQYNQARALSESELTELSTTVTTATQSIMTLTSTVAPTPQLSSHRLTSSDYYYSSASSSRHHLSSTSSSSPLPMMNRTSLIPDREHYKIVFISPSNSSRADESSHSDDTDNETISTAGSCTGYPNFAFDDYNGEWDYFESTCAEPNPAMMLHARRMAVTAAAAAAAAAAAVAAAAAAAAAAASTTVPAPAPNVVSQVTAVARSAGVAPSFCSCQHFVPIPVPIPVPFPVPVPYDLWWPALQLAGLSRSPIESGLEATRPSTAAGASVERRTAPELTTGDEPRSSPERYKTLIMINHHADTIVSSAAATPTTTIAVPPTQHEAKNEVNILTTPETMSAVLEDGLADDDSWVDDSDRNTNNNNEDDDDDDEDDWTSGDDEYQYQSHPDMDHQEEDDHDDRPDLDKSLYTIHEVTEESEEDELLMKQQQQQQQKQHASPSLLENYFHMKLGNNAAAGIPLKDIEDSFSESSYQSDRDEEDYEDLHQPVSSRRHHVSLNGGLHIDDGDDEDDDDDLVRKQQQLASNLEKYYMSELVSSIVTSDGSGSVGSDSEGGGRRPSPEHRRKRFLRNRNTSRQTSNSLDNLNQIESLNNSIANVVVASDAATMVCDEDSSTETDTNDIHGEIEELSLNGLTGSELLELIRKQQSRDSGFLGSDDLLDKDRLTTSTASTTSTTTTTTTTTSSSVCSSATSATTTTSTPSVVDKPERQIRNPSFPPATSLTRKDSFNNWSSDEETNMMMGKMRVIFKSLIAHAQQQTTPQASPRGPRANNKKTTTTNNNCNNKPPQLILFEEELRRLMKTVPGIRDEYVNEFLESLSSEETYDSSSDRDCLSTKSNTEEDEDQQMFSRPLAYQRLVSRIDNKNIEEREDQQAAFAHIMQHIGSRLVALMHEVSESASSSPHRPRRAHYRSSAIDEDSSSHTDSESSAGPAGGAPLATHQTSSPRNSSSIPNHLLARSKSHELLLDTDANRNGQQETEGCCGDASCGSDYERFSWRGSFESTLMAADSRTRLSLVNFEAAAKRRSAGDLLVTTEESGSNSNLQLDRVRSCGSIGPRRGSVPDSDEELLAPARSTTLPRSIQTGGPPTATNSLPRLPTSTAVKSARYRPPGFSKPTPCPTPPKRAVSAPGLQQRRERRRSGNHYTNNNTNILSSSAISSSVASGSSLANSSTVGFTGITHSHSAEDATLLGSSTEFSVPGSPLVGGSSEWSPSCATSSSVANVAASEERLIPIQRSASTGMGSSSLGPRSDSMASVYSGAGESRYGTVTVRGQVEFGLQYNYKAGALEILVRQCRDLAPVDVKKNRSDPYVKIYLLPDRSKSGKRKTKVRKNTLQPLFNENLKFTTTLTELKSRTLWLTVWHSDMFGRNDFLGEVTMPLHDVIFNDPSPHWYQLHERSEPFEELNSYKGEITIGLKFVPPDDSALSSTSSSLSSMHHHQASSSSTSSLGKKSKRLLSSTTGALHVLIKGAKHLTAVKANGTCDVFCKSYLLPNKSKSSKHKTPIARRTLSPHWNHTIVYPDITLEELAERSLELTLWDHDMLGTNEFLGGVILSANTTSTTNTNTNTNVNQQAEREKTETVTNCDDDDLIASSDSINVWKTMMERPNFWVEGNLKLKSPLTTMSTTLSSSVLSNTLK